MKVKQCINCGALLHSNICEYCDTEYELDETGNHTQKGRQVNEFLYKLDILGREHDFYVASIKTEPTCIFGRNAQGNICGQVQRTKRKMVLIEM